MFCLNSLASAPSVDPAAIPLPEMHPPSAQRGPDRGGSKVHLAHASTGDLPSVMPAATSQELAKRLKETSDNACLSLSEIWRREGKGEGVGGRSTVGSQLVACCWL